MVSDDVMEKHLIWATTISKRISKIDDLFGTNYVFLWTVPSKSTFQNLKSISETLTLPEILEETASIIMVVGENEFEEDKLGGLLRTFAKGRKLKLPKYMGFLRTVLSGQKVRLLIHKTYCDKVLYNNYSGYIFYNILIFGLRASANTYDRSFDYERGWLPVVVLCKITLRWDATNNCNN